MKLNEARGDWALVTGASSGIGAEYCRHLAAAGMNLVIVARRKQQMDELAEEIKAQHGIRVFVFPCDLSVPFAAAKVKSAVEREGIRIRLLCNNAAFGPWGHFENTSAADYESLIQLIAGTTVSMCSHFLPDLSSYPASVVINVSSPAALQPVCYLNVYASAKAFVHHFSLALHGEWKDRGVLVQTFMPGPTQSEMDGKAGAYICALPKDRWHPRETVEVSLRHLNLGTPLVTNAAGTYKQRFFAGLFPTRTVIRTVEKMFRPPKGHQPRLALNNTHAMSREQESSS